MQRSISLMFSLLICATDLASANANNEQSFNVHNNDSVNAVISQKELSRIIFKSEQVTKIMTISGQLHYEIVDNNLYLRPIATDKPINFFVETNNGNTYKIIAETKDIPATQVFINNIKGNVSKVIKTTKGESDAKEAKKYTGENILRGKIAKIIAVALSEDETLGYHKKTLRVANSNILGLAMKGQSKWLGEKLIAEKYQLSNRTNVKVVINSKEFLNAIKSKHSNVIGVYLEQDQIMPNEATSLIIIKRG